METWWEGGSGQAQEFNSGLRHQRFVAWWGDGFSGQSRGRNGKAELSRFVFRSSPQFFGGIIPMNTRFLYVLPLAAALMLPAAAQQTQSTQSANPQTSSDQQAAPTAQPVADQNAQNSSDVQRQPLTYERHEGFWGKINPFARKKYVNRQLDPIRGRVNELDELTAKNAKMIADVDTRATEGIRQAMSKANDADTHALDAGNRANQAQQTAQQATTRIGTVETAVSKIDQYEPITQA